MAGCPRRWPCWPYWVWQARWRFITRPRAPCFSSCSLPMRMPGCPGLPWSLLHCGRWRSWRGVSGSRASHGGPLAMPIPAGRWRATRPGWGFTASVQSRLGPHSCWPDFWRDQAAAAGPPACGWASCSRWAWRPNGSVRRSPGALARKAWHCCREISRKMKNFSPAPGWPMRFAGTGSNCKRTSPAWWWPRKLPFRCCPSSCQTATGQLCRPVSPMAGRRR